MLQGLGGNAYANSTTLFGREYLAFSDGRTGTDLPRQYDDTNFDRVSQGGPGAGPAVVDENIVVAIAASPNGATQPARSRHCGQSDRCDAKRISGDDHYRRGARIGGGTVDHDFGSGSGGYNGTFSVIGVPSSTQFTYVAGVVRIGGIGRRDECFGDGDDSNHCGARICGATTGEYQRRGRGRIQRDIHDCRRAGLYAFHLYRDELAGWRLRAAERPRLAGSVGPGVHQVCVIFKTRQGYLTQPGPATSWTVERRTSAPW